MFCHYHALSSYYIVHHTSSMKVIQKNCSKRENLKKIQLVQILCTSFTDVKHSHDVCQHVKIIFRFILSGIDPLRWNGHCFSYVYIKALSDGMVIDFLMFTSRSSPMEWSLISYVYIKALSDGMVIDFLILHQGPLRWNGHWFSYVYIKALSYGMIIDFLMFTLRPSPMEWSLIFLCLHQGLLRWKGHWFSYVYTNALSNEMVSDFFLVFWIRPFSYEWLIPFFTFRILTLFVELVIASLQIIFIHPLPHPLQNSGEISVSIFTYILLL